jgi:hypothetical protein
VDVPLAVVATVSLEVRAVNDAGLDYELLGRAASSARKARRRASATSEMAIATGAVSLRWRRRWAWRRWDGDEDKA